MKKSMKWLFMVAIVLMATTAYVYIKPENFQILTSKIESSQKHDATDKDVLVYKIVNLNDATNIDTVAGSLSLEEIKDSDNIVKNQYKLKGKNILDSNFEFVTLSKKIESGSETLIIANGSNGNYEEGSEIISINQDGSYHDLSKSFGDYSHSTPKISIEGDKVKFEYETSEKYMTGQEYWTYQHGLVSGPTRNVKPKYDFDVSKLEKLESDVAQDVKGKIISDKNGSLVLKTTARLLEPCNEEPVDTFVFEPDIALPKKEAEGIFKVEIGCGSRAENFSPRITVISTPFGESFAIKNIRIGMTLEELAPYISSGSIRCPNERLGGSGITDVRLCAIDPGGGYGPPEKHVELADSVAGRKVDGISLLFYKNTLYAAMIELHSGNRRQIEEVFEALNKKFGNASTEITKIKGMDISPLFISFDYLEFTKTVAHTTMWTSTNGQLLFFGAAKVFPIRGYEIGRVDVKVDSSSYKLYMDSDYDPNNPPKGVIITTVDPATVEMIASQVEGVAQEANERANQKAMQQRTDELNKKREQAKQDALSL
jgi:hypothetical protein